VAIVMAAILWGLGTIFQRRKAVSLEPEVSSGYQLLFGGLGLLAASTLSGEPGPEPIPEAWLAWGYLILFGSVVAFTSFIKATRLLPMNIVMTYAYVNPVVAVILGRIILGEPVTRWTIGGSVLIVLGVMGVFHEQPIRNGRRNKRKNSGAEAEVTAASNTD
jgi:drug/metabolite transporter (DMT)-like permease